MLNNGLENAEVKTTYVRGDSFGLHETISYVQANMVRVDFFKKIKEPELLKGILHVRDEEVEHIKLAEELLEILRTRAEAGGKIIAAPRGKPDAISERKGLINLTAAVLRAKIQLISLVEKLDLANQKLRELNNLKSNFISIAAHQLKGPLTSMRWFFDLLLGGRVGKLNQKQKD